MFASKVSKQHSSADAHWTAVRAHQRPPVAATRFGEGTVAAEPIDAARELEADQIASAALCVAHVPPRSAATSARAPQALDRSGRPLDGATRSFFEPRLGHDLGEVRVHTGPEADASARSAAAAAYAVGADIVFGAGQYAPHTVDGRRLLAHELAHVVQAKRQPGLGLARQPKVPETTPLVTELTTLIADATWPEIRKRVYPVQSSAGITRAKERHAGTRPDLTGVGQIKSLDRFADAVRTIQTSWADLKTGRARAGKLADAADLELQAAGVPKFMVVATEKMVERGYFQAATWKFAVQQDLVSAPTLPPAEAADVANVTLHETRHAEQRFLAARFAAGSTKKPEPSAIADEVGIPQLIAKKAVEKKFDKTTDAATADRGKTMYQSTVTDAETHGQTTQNVKDAIGLLDRNRKDCTTALAGLKAHPSATAIAAAEKARDALRAQVAVVEKNYAAYRAIPAEADAHEVGDAEEQAFKKWP